MQGGGAGRLRVTILPACSARSRTWRKASAIVEAQDIVVRDRIERLRRVRSNPRPRLPKQSPTAEGIERVVEQAVKQGVRNGRVTLRGATISSGSRQQSRGSSWVCNQCERAIEGHPYRKQSLRGELAGVGLEALAERVKEMVRAPGVED
jgi:hypothetical protein